MSSQLIILYEDIAVFVDASFIAAQCTLHTCMNIHVLKHAGLFSSLLTIYKQWQHLL